MESSLSKLKTDIDAALREGEIGEIAVRIGETVNPARVAADLLNKLRKSTNLNNTADHAREEAKLTDADPIVFIRWLLLEGARERLATWEGAGLPAELEELLVQQIRIPLDKSPAAARLLDAGRGNSLRSLCEVIEGDRYPGGQLDWMLSGFPRSWLLKMPRTHLPAALRTLLFETRGFAPLAEFHLNPRRRNPRILLEKEFERSYRLAARWLLTRPDVKGVFTVSWLWGPETAEATPHLAWLPRTPSDNGAFYCTLGPAAPDTGFLSASKDRRGLFDSGELQFRVGAWVWPRAKLIEWARSQPEFDA